MMSVSTGSLMQPADQNKRFLHVLSECAAECDDIKKQIAIYSDAKDTSDADITQATAMQNSLISIRRLFEAINL